LVEFFQHTDAVTNIIKTSDPNVKKVKFNIRHTNCLAGFKEIHGDKKRAAVHSTLVSFIRRPTTPALTLPATTAKLNSF
jgi:hypothetical protein